MSTNQLICEFNSTCGNILDSVAPHSLVLRVSYFVFTVSTASTVQTSVLTIHVVVVPDPTLSIQDHSLLWELLKCFIIQDGLHTIKHRSGSPGLFLLCYCWKIWATVFDQIIQFPPSSFWTSGMWGPSLIVISNLTNRQTLWWKVILQLRKTAKLKATVSGDDIYHSLYHLKVGLFLHLVSRYQSVSCFLWNWDKILCCVTSVKVRSRFNLVKENKCKSRSALQRLKRTQDLTNKLMGRLNLYWG